MGALNYSLFLDSFFKNLENKALVIVLPIFLHKSHYFKYIKSHIVYYY